MTINSYRRVLRVRRHLHQIQWDPLDKSKTTQLDRPVPLMGITYCAVLYLVFIIISRLPIVGALADLPWRLWWVIPPVLTYVLIVNEPAFDQRLPHQWVRSLVRFWFRAKRTRAGVPIKADGRQRGRIHWFADETHPDLHRARVTGPATVHFHVPVRSDGETYPETAVGLWLPEHRLEIKP